MTASLDQHARCDGVRGLARPNADATLQPMTPVARTCGAAHACALAVLSLLAALAMWSSAALAQAAPQGAHHNSIAVIIGNQKYRHTTPVIYAHNDARAIEKYLVERLGFRRANIMVRLDLGREQMETLFGEPDRADGEMMDRLLDRRLENRGDVFVFYSGHGVPDPDAVHDDGRRAFLLPTDVRQDRIAAAAFPIDRLHKKLELVRGQLPADRRVVLMMDACFSGRTPVARGATGAGDGPDASLFKFSRGSFSVRAEEPSAGIIRLVAATGDQVAYWDERTKLGLFTAMFLRGVGGEADSAAFGNGDRQIAGDELLRYLEERVPAEARLRHQRTQRPTLEGLDRFAWTPPVKAGQIVQPPAAPAPPRAQPAALPTVSPAVLPTAPPTAAAPALAPAKPIAAPQPPPKAPARAALPVDEDKVRPPTAPPKRTARPAPRPAADDDEEEARPRPRRARAAPRPAPEPRPPTRSVEPAPAREPAGACRVINGVRFCG
jgi:Caspase domain